MDFPKILIISVTRATLNENIVINEYINDKNDLNSIINHPISPTQPHEISPLTISAQDNPIINLSKSRVLPYYTLYPTQQPIIITPQSFFDDGYYTGLGYQPPLIQDLQQVPNIQYYNGPFPKLDMDFSRLSCT